MKLKDYQFTDNETNIYFYVPKELVADFAKYDYSRLRSFVQKGNQCYYYVDICVNTTNPKALSDKTFPELFDAMQDYDIIKIDHNGIWVDFIYLGTEDEGLK